MRYKLFLMTSLIINLMMQPVTSYSQDPNFAQFFSSPLNINPALAGNINADWRIISNFRDQWIGPASPYVTGTISYDRKLFQNQRMDFEEGNRFGVGAMLMYDRAMAGVAKNTYASANFAYNVKLSSGAVINRLGMGLGATYGRKFIDFSKLDFEEQFVGNGFDTGLPTGEEALANMTPYVSLSGGLVYSRSTEKSNIDIGIAGFHFNSPKQTFLEDPNQILPMRKVIHANMELLLNESLSISTNATYQRQSTANYYSIGTSVGYTVSTMPQIIINAGLWYWSQNHLTPYVGFSYNDFQIGLSYDAVISKLMDAPRRANSFELSLIQRGIKKYNKSRGIPCPWK